jgi:hypothetical protein
MNFDTDTVLVEDQIRLETFYGERGTPSLLCRNLEGPSISGLCGRLQQAKLVETVIFVEANTKQAEVHSMEFLVQPSRKSQPVQQIEHDLT